MSENTVASYLQADAVKGWPASNAMILAHSVHNDSQMQCGIMSNNLKYSDVQYYNFMNLFDLQDVISPSSEEESVQNIIWSPRGCLGTEKHRIKNLQYSIGTPWFADDKASRNCEANIKWPKNNIRAADVPAKTRAWNPGKCLAPVSAENKNGESKRVRISSKDFVLPQGWITWKQERLNGKSAGNKDAHYMELSTKKRFRSRVEVKNYLQNKEQDNQMVVPNEVDHRYSQVLITVEESYGLQGTTASISTDHVHHRKKTLTREKLQVRRPKKKCGNKEEWHIELRR